jgi:hypothetical protein
MFSEATLQLQQRFMLYEKQISDMPKAAKKRARKEIAKISAPMRRRFGLNDESRA